MIVEALRALYDLASKCDVCEEHVATRGDDDTRLCDREACNAVLACVACGSADAFGFAAGLRCRACGTSISRSAPIVAAPVDLPHAAALRAANAAHEAGR